MPLPPPDHAQYKLDQEGDARILAEINRKKRKREDGDDTKLEYDRRAQSDAQLEHLQSLLMTIFEAEDHIAPDTSGVISEQVHSLFVPTSAGSGTPPTLATQALDDLDTAILKVVKADRFGSIAVEQLCHLQQLCAASVSKGVDINPSVPSDTSDDALDLWLSNMTVSMNSLKASKTLLRTMTAGRDENQLYSDDVIQDMISNIRHLLDDCILPLAEKRSSVKSIDAFSERTEGHQSLINLSQTAGRVLKMLGDLVLKQDLSESSLNSIEYIALKVVFVENASADKDSLLGVQKVELLRRHGMDTVAKTFLKCPNQRKSIFSEILTSLEKLPVTRQSARQFKIPGAKPIQLVSALIMQLIQTSTTTSERSKLEGDTERMSDSEESSDAEDSSSPTARSSRIKRKKSNSDHQPASGDVLARLHCIAKPLFESSLANAAFVIRYMVERAMKSTKGGESPFRNLMDIFTEDFINVLGSPLWPAAGHLLQALLRHLFSIMEDKKSPVPAKNMALDLMSWIGSTIADLRLHAMKVSESHDSLSDGGLPDLAQLCEDSTKGAAAPSDLLRLDGPYRRMIEYLHTPNHVDVQESSAISSHIANWSYSLSTPSPDIDERGQAKLSEAGTWLLTNLSEPSQLGEKLGGYDTSESASRTCYALILLNSSLCKAYGRILAVLSASLVSPQATLRTRALRSLPQLLEKDPTILDESNHILACIQRCATEDSSSQVRDSALTLLEKCVVLRPALGVRACKCFMDRASDSAVGVRKKAVTLLRDTYIRNSSQELRAAVADTILHRLKDPEDKVADLARQTFEEIWLNPFHSICGAETLSTQGRKDLEQHSFLIIATAQRSLEATDMLEALFRDALGKSTKAAMANKLVCKAVVSLLFECILDNDQTKQRPAQKDCLYGLTIFAKVEPRLFNTDQMHKLRPYLRNLNTPEDLLLYRPTLMIYRRVLPVLPIMQKEFLLSIENVLVGTITSIGKLDLIEAAMCLRIINGVTQDTSRVVKIILQVLLKLDFYSRSEAPGNEDQKRLTRFLLLAGSFGKAFDFEAERKVFEEKLPAAKSIPIREFIITTLLPFNAEKYGLSIQESALDAVAMLCQSWPKGFKKAACRAAFKSALQSNEPRLVELALSGLRDFYFDVDDPSKAGLASQQDGGATKADDRLGKSYVQNDRDAAAMDITQRLFPEVCHIALNSTGHLALISTELLACLSRQGVRQAKDFLGAFVALGTSPDPLISKISLEEHRTIVAKQESSLDRENVSATDTAFMYAKGGLKSESGIDLSGKPRLAAFYEVLKTGSVVTRKKLLSGLCNRIDEQSKSGTGYPYSRYVLENLGLLDYGKVDELLTFLDAADKVLNTTGNSLAQQLESLLHDQNQVQVSGDTMVDGEEEQKQPKISEEDLRRLAPQIIVLSALWETRSHIKRAWGLQALRNGKSKPAPKDTGKPPLRAANVDQAAFLAKFDALSSAMQDQASMLAACHAFLEQMTIDNEQRLNSDEDANDSTERQNTPSDHGTEGSGSRASQTPASQQKSRKKRAPSSVASTPSKAGKAKGRPPGLGRRRSSKGPVKYDDEGWD